MDGLMTLIGCGNAARSDDGVGCYVAAQLIPAFDGVPGVQIFDAGTGGMDVMFKARGSERLIIVDACTGAGDAGAVFEIPAKQIEIEQEPPGNLHDFRWQHALYAGRKIFADDFPRDVVVTLIEAENLDFGVELSDVVQRAADTVIERLVARLHEHTANSRFAEVDHDY